VAEGDGQCLLVLCYEIRLFIQVKTEKNGISSSKTLNDYYIIGATKTSATDIGQTPLFASVHR